MKSIYDIVNLYKELGFNVEYKEEKKEEYKKEEEKK
jgi:hypothetical protein